MKTLITILVLIGLLILNGCESPVNETGGKVTSNKMVTPTENDLLAVTIYFKDNTVKNYICKRVEYEAIPFPYISLIGGSPIGIPLESILNYTIVKQ